MYELNEDKVKSNALVSHFLEDPTQSLSEEELNTLLAMDYRGFLYSTERIRVNLVDFLSLIKHIKGLDYLSTHLPLQARQALFKNDGNRMFCWAAANGHLEIMQYLAKLAPDLLPERIKAGQYLAFYLAASNGHAEVVQSLAKFAPALLPEMVKTEDYRAFRSAASHGHVEVVQSLEKLAPALLPNMMNSNHYSAFCRAAENGHEEVVQCLAKLAPALLPEMVKSNHYSAFRLATVNGHLAVVQYLAELTPDLLPEMVKTSDYYAIKEAAKRDHYPIIAFLLHQTKADAKTIYNALSSEQKKSLNDERFKASCAQHDLAKSLVSDVVSKLLNLKQANQVMFFKSVETFRKEHALDVLKAISSIPL